MATKYSNALIYSEHTDRINQCYLKFDEVGFTVKTDCGFFKEVPDKGEMWLFCYPIPNEDFPIYSVPKVDGKSDFSAKTLIKELIPIGIRLHTQSYKKRSRLPDGDWGDVTLQPSKIEVVYGFILRFWGQLGFKNPFDPFKGEIGFEYMGKHLEILYLDSLKSDIQQTDDDFAELAPYARLLLTTEKDVIDTALSTKLEQYANAFLSGVDTPKGAYNGSSSKAAQNRKESYADRLTWLMTQLQPSDGENSQLLEVAAKLMEIQVGSPEYAKAILDVLKVVVK